MLEPCPATVRFAAAVVSADLASDDSARPSDLTQYVAKRLYPRFSMLVGCAGVDALLGRSLALAQRDRWFPGEAGVGADEMLVGLAASARDGALDQSAAIAIVSRFLEVMIQLVGEDLTLRLLRGAGPGGREVRLDDAAR
jgi:hypothetical protein